MEKLGCAEAAVLGLRPRGYGCRRMLNTEEDSDHYKIGFRHLNELLRTMIDYKGLKEPKAGLLCQADGDWTPALRKEHKDFVPYVLCDLEHHYRHIGKRQVLGIPIGIFLRYNRALAFISTIWMGSLYLKIQVQRMHRPWNSVSFPKNFCKQCLRRIPIPGEEPIWVAMFWCGLGSRSRAGYALSAVGVPAVRYGWF